MSSAFNKFLSIYSFYKENVEILTSSGGRIYNVKQFVLIAHTSFVKTIAILLNLGDST